TTTPLSRSAAASANADRSAPTASSRRAPAKGINATARPYAAATRVDPRRPASATTPAASSNARPSIRAAGGIAARSAGASEGGDDPREGGDGEDRQEVPPRAAAVEARRHDALPGLAHEDVLREHGDPRRDGDKPGQGHHREGEHPAPVEEASQRTVPSREQR